MGSCLRANYRYYICRGTHPTASRDKICNAHYIKAEWLEGVVWDKVKSVLEHPELLLAEVRKQTEVQKGQVLVGELEHQIKTISRKLKKYDGQERRLMDLLRLEVATPDVVLDTLNQVKKERDTAKAKLASLIQTQENIARMADYEDRLKELCARIAPDIENCTSQDKKDAYTYLDLKVTATSEGADIKGYLDSSVLTTGQTSA